MPRSRQSRPTRGVFEHPEGSGVWWVNYYVRGKRHREKVGRKSDAIALYQNRKTDARRNIKLPELGPGKQVSFGELASAAVEFARAHLKAFRGYEIKEGILREPFGSRPASDITPSEIDTWLTKHCKKPATANRYRAFFSLAFRLGMENGRVGSNPARLVRRRREENERLRFLSRDEYKELSKIIKRDHPKQHPSLVFGVFTGMRWGEQFSLTWQHVDLTRRIARLTKTKSGSPRNVPLNSEAYAAILEQRELVPHRSSDPVFPLRGPSADCRWWLVPALAKANITGVTWHTLRHTFCSWAAMEGLSLKVIQILAGHKTITMAARYAHLAPDTAIEASEKIVRPSNL